MINKRLAENFLNDARLILREAEESFKARRYHRVVRLSQECFELSMKASLRAVAIEYPRAHDMSDALLENRKKFPQWLSKDLPEMAEASMWLAEKRGLSMYGDEVRGIPASRFFKRKDAERALKYAGKATKATSKLLRELFK